ncbi:LacI family DNA-binding transcriptional regulator [Tunturiibacter lichenicola]|uniref:LacI family DNA-binding transcriptional regulator n=1 Tax=Tunturiibacter lichenicola TaxID=2051959 RepID=UPI003D9B1148
MAKSARMIDVAKLAGVSIMTVSRVLNGSANVTDGLRDKVFAAIEHLSYQRNEVARSLREQRSRQIGILVPYLFDPFFASCAHVISTVARQHAYSVVLSTSNEDPQTEYEEASRMLRRNVEGLIVIPSHPQTGQSPLLADKFKSMPIVALDRPIEGSGFDSLLVENQRGAALGTEHLLSLGHKRIAYIGLSDDLYTMCMRHRGYNLAMEAVGLKPVAAICSSALDDALVKVRELLSSKRKPTALFCANNLTTRHVLHSLQTLGIYPPNGVALVGFDDFETADLLRPGITVVRQPSELLGRTAADVLFKRLGDSRKTKTGKSTVLPVELIVRGSCGARIRHK